MALVAGLHGTIAILLICALLYVEESGVPLPLVPGDALLIVAGVLAANGSISLWIFLPVAFVATAGGALTGYTWSRTIGAGAVTAVAQRFRADKALERASTKLRAADPIHIAIVRHVPGMRVYTAIVCGAAGVDLRVFLLGAVPSIAVWLLIYAGVGFLVGVPALASLSHVQHLAVTGAGLVVIGAATLLGIHRIPHGEEGAPALLRTPFRWLMVLAGAIDLTVAMSLVSGVIELLHEWLGLADPDGVIDLALIAAVVILFYVAATRSLIGATAGEHLLGIRYPAHSRDAARQDSDRSRTA